MEKYRYSLFFDHYLNKFYFVTKYGIMFIENYLLLIIAIMGSWKKSNFKEL
jgi:hypothetical protein